MCALRRCCVGSGRGSRRNGAVRRSDRGTGPPALHGTRRPHAWLREERVFRGESPSRKLRRKWLGQGCLCRSTDLCQFGDNQIRSDSKSGLGRSGRLENGESEIVTLRNKLHRFTRAEAEAFSAQLNLSFAKAKEEGDPICYTDESKGYGPRSILLQQFGLRERIRPVKTAQIRKYEVRLDREYTRPGYWYAPLIALRLLDTGEPFDLGGAAVLLTDPLSVGRFLENWDDAGWKPPPLETVALLSDNAFDQYMQQVDKEIGVAVVDPLFDPQTQKPLSATQIISTEKLIAHARGRGR